MYFRFRAIFTDLLLIWPSVLALLWVCNYLILLVKIVTSSSALLCEINLKGSDSFVLCFAYQFICDYDLMQLNSNVPKQIQLSRGQWRKFRVYLSKDFVRFKKGFSDSKCISVFLKYLSAWVLSWSVQYTWVKLLFQTTRNFRRATGGMRIASDCPRSSSSPQKHPAIQRYCMKDSVVAIITQVMDCSIM